MDFFEILKNGIANKPSENIVFQMASAIKNMMLTNRLFIIVGILPLQFKNDSDKLFRNM